MVTRRPVNPVSLRVPVPMQELLAPDSAGGS